jgi:hypothetical protein
LQNQEEIEGAVVAVIERVGQVITRMKTGQKTGFTNTILLITGCAAVVGLASVPGGFRTLATLALVAGVLILAKPALLKSAEARLKTCKVRATRNRPGR